jgi:excisionase family DNA binding protein
MDRLLSVAQAAERLGGISTFTIFSWCSKGRLQRTKVGSRTMIRESELERFIAVCNKYGESGEQSGERTDSKERCQ